MAFCRMGPGFEDEVALFVLIAAETGEFEGSGTSSDHPQFFTQGSLCYFLALLV